MSHLLNVRENVVIPESSDYKTFVAERPVYRLLMIPPTGTNNFAVNSATIDSYFEVTPNVFNFSKSFLEYNLNIDAQGVGRFNYIYKNKPNVQAFEVYTKSGIRIVDINYVNKLIWTIGRKNMKFTDYISRQAESTCNPLHGKYVTFAGADLGAVQTANNSSGNKRPGGTVVEDKYIESQYLEVGGSNVATNLRIRFPLSDIAETLFSLDKDIYFKENLIIRVAWEPKNMVGYHSDSAVDPTSDTKVFADDSVTLDSIQLRVAVQTNRKLIESTMALVDSGLSIDIPYVTYLRSPGGAVAGGGALNASVKITTGMGKTLLKVIHSLFNTSEEKHTSFDNSNRSADGKTTLKVKSYYTQINSQRIQDYNLVCSTKEYAVGTDAVGTADDFQWNSFFIKNSPIFNAGVYIANWFHEDNFSNVNNDSSIKESQIAAPGIPIDTELTWYFYGQAPAAGTNVIHHTIIVTRKTLTIAPTGVTLK